MAWLCRSDQTANGGLLEGAGCVFPLFFASVLGENAAGMGRWWNFPDTAGPCRGGIFSPPTLVSGQPSKKPTMGRFLPIVALDTVISCSAVGIEKQTKTMIYIIIGHILGINIPAKYTRFKSL